MHPGVSFLSPLSSVYAFIGVSVATPDFFLSDSNLRGFLNGVPLDSLLRSSVTFVTLSVIGPFSSLFTFLTVSLRHTSNNAGGVFSRMCSSVSSSGPTPSSADS